MKPTWAVFHTGDVGLSGKADEEVFAWAQQQAAVIVTFDEDLADGRSFPDLWAKCWEANCCQPTLAKLAFA